MKKSEIFYALNPWELDKCVSELTGDELKVVMGALLDTLLHKKPIDLPIELMEYYCSLMRCPLSYINKKKKDGRATTSAENGKKHIKKDVTQTEGYCTDNRVGEMFKDLL